MANKISEQLFEAVDVLIGKRILDSAKDKTILCTIEDNSKAADGEYTVSNASARFTAYSENTKYRNGQNVWVLVPDGDYNNDKIIVSKYAKDSSAPFTYVDPMDTFINMTDNILNSSEAAEETGLLANSDYPISILSIVGIEEQEFKQLTDAEGRKNVKLPPDASITDPKPVVLSDINITPITLVTPTTTHLLNGVDVSGYDKFAIKADFKTAFGSPEPISGTYGLCIVIRAEKGDEKTKQTSTYTIFFDSSQMWGNPYNYFDYFTQTAVFSWDSEEKGVPVGVDCYFYQNFDFIGEDGNPLPYYTATNFDENGEPIEYEYLSKNIFVKNIQMYFGYSVDDITETTLKLFTTSSKDYSLKVPTSKDLKLRYIYVPDGITRAVIESEEKLKEYIVDNQELKNQYPIIHWYRRRESDNIKDSKGNLGWEEFYPDNLFNSTISDLKDDLSESFRCTICANNNALYYLVNLHKRINEIEDTKLVNFCNKWYNFYNGISPINENEVADISIEITQAVYNAAVRQMNKEGFKPGDEGWDERIAEIIADLNTQEKYAPINYIQQAWADSDNPLYSNTLVFRNINNLSDAVSDRLKALQLTSGDNSRGVFNIYEATLAADNQLINQADAYIPRLINASFKSSVADDKGLADALRLAWYVPKARTMIKPPAEGKTYSTGEMPQYCFASKLDIDNYKESHSLSNEEYDLFVSRINDYYILLHDWTHGGAPQDNVAQLTYYIQPRLVKQWNNNTILASLYKDQQIYEGENASITLTFGVKGANGTDYTLIVSMTNELKGSMNADMSTWELVASPSAWTYNYDRSSEDNTCAMQLFATLYDVDDKPVTNATFSWEVLNDKMGMFNHSIRNSSINEIDGPWLLSGSGAPNINNSDDCRGAIIKCTAISDYKRFNGYLIIPVRTNRSVEAIQGATMIRYDSSGVKPQYYNGPYGFIDIQGNIDYTNIEVEMKIPADNENNRVKQYYPEVIKNANGYCLKAQTMYFKNVDYDCHVKISKDNVCEWKQPILVVMDPYGNALLNSWNGDLVIDKDNNQIMASVIGAGKKEDDNSFTGLLLGDLPTVEGTTNKTGLLGYEHGEQSYGIFDDGSAFLGKSSVAQIRFDGTTGVLGNSGYLNQEIYANKVGTILSLAGDENSPNKPYFDMKAANGAGVYLGTGGGKTDSTAYFSDAPVNNLYFRITAPKEDGDVDALGTELIHIGKSEYYLQTKNFVQENARTVSTVSGDGFQILDGKNKDIPYASSGMKLNLKNGSLLSNNFELLSTKNGDYKSGFIRLSAKANKYPLNINNKFLVDWNGNLNAKDAKLTNADVTGKITATSGKLTNVEVDTLKVGGKAYSFSQITYVTGISSFSRTGTSGISVLTSVSGDCWNGLAFGVGSVTVPTGYSLTLSRATSYVLGGGGNAADSSKSATGGGATSVSYSEATGASSWAGSCFIAGTMITLANGRKKAIELIKPGDIILAYDELLHIYTPQVVSHTQIRYTTKNKISDICFNDNTILSMTIGHPILTTEGWKSLDKNIALQEHRINTAPIMLQQEAIGFIQNKIITSIQYDNSNEKCAVYNISVFKNHNYLANDVVVHNAPDYSK